MPPPHLQSSSVEDLSVVMGRFHAWDAIQKGVPPAAADDEVRELSPEEAAAARPAVRSMRPALEAAMASIHEASNRIEPRASAETEAALKLAKHMIEESENEGSDLPNSSVVKKPRARSSRPPAKKMSTVAPASNKKKQAKPSGADKTVKAPAVRQAAAPKKKTAAPTTFRTALAASLKEEARRTSAAKTSALPKKTAAKSVTVQAAEPAPRTRPKTESVPQTVGPKFRSPLRTISVNVRVTPQEHARIRQGASRAGLNLASFLRETALQAQLAQEQARQIADDSRSRPISRIVDPAKSTTGVVESYRRPIVETSGISMFAWIKGLLLGRSVALTA